MTLPLIISIAFNIALIIMLLVQHVAFSSILDTWKETCATWENDHRSLRNSFGILFKQYASQRRQLVRIMEEKEGVKL